ncbi:MAG TPA: Fur family transcriptional regulator [Candidatus Sulfomarinibacteraceae bacterium]|nr:Fur family transcriptional regulator [Candidatus Sulfomarinibacteraceae bacterium]
MSHKERDFARRIRQQGYRFTPQRQLILDALCGLGGHATVDEIYEVVNATAPSINLATVYRTVRFLEELRLVVSADIQGQTVYEIAQPTPHHHLVCRECGDVQVLGDEHLQELAATLAREHQFQAELDHMAISGLCAGCQTEQDEA